MPYLSELTNKPVADVDGETLGSLGDLVTVVRGQMAHPEVVAVSVKRPGGPLLVSIEDAAVLFAPAIPLKVHRADIVPYQPGEHDLYLVRDVLDKQIIDTDGVRVVRVNDLELVKVNDHYYVANVDIGGLGLLRRLGVAKGAQKMSKRLNLPLPPGVISWDNVELIADNQPMRLKVPGSKISELHPADIAELLSDLSHFEGSHLLDTLDVETAADTLEEVEPDFQVSLIEAMPDEKVADILEEMAPDEAADLLGELPDERSEELLGLMEADEATDVRKLMTYPDDTAGGIMTTEYVTVPRNFTAEQAIRHLRDTVTEAEPIFYVYVTDVSEHLVGVLSLSDLILAQPYEALNDFMHHRVVKVHPEDSQDEVARVVAKYNLLAVPVVDNADRLQGIVTADDALDKIIPTAWKKRLPRMYR